MVEAAGERLVMAWLMEDAVVRRVLCETCINRVCLGGLRALEGRIEVRTIFDDRPADVAAELVPIKVRIARLEWSRTVHELIAKKLEGFSMAALRSILLCTRHQAAH